MNRLFGSNKSRGISDQRNARVDSVFDLGYYKKNVHNLSQWWALAIVVSVLALGGISKYQLLRLPRGLTANDEPHHPGVFIAERARVDLRILNDFGPKPTGSYANEVLALDFLKREVAHIQSTAHPSQMIYADTQRVSGGYWAAFKPHPMTNVYRDVQNVVVRLIGEAEQRNESNHTLMLNCHFDSVAGSPGASDDSASCCVMLEILRVLSNEPKPRRHSLLLLFNGAEETPLQASHGFISQHNWAGSVRAFLNLESVGSNGKEILFQSGPNHSWLIDMYKRAAVHPSGHVAAEEIFQSGLVPSDTDFRIFRDYGHIPGMDFAHVMNGYRYHTKYDNIEFISADVLQRTGDNILELTRLMLDADELADTESFATGRQVFFDVLGLFFVSYDENIGHAINLAIAAIAIIVPYYFLSRSTQGTHGKRIRREMLIGLVVNGVAAVVALSVNYGVATELDFSDNSMVWFHHTIFALALYCLPTVAVFCVLHRLFGVSPNNPLSLSLQVQARLNGTTIMYAILLLAVTATGYRSAYVFAVPLLITCSTNIVIGLAGIGNSIRNWLYVHLAGQVFVVLWTTHFYHLLTGIFIPIAGRSGGLSNPDVAIAIICCLMTIYITSFLTPLVMLLSRVKWLLFSMGLIFILTRWGCISLTHAGFPYRDSSAGGNPTPQRHMITHTVRSVYDEHGQLTYTDSGFYFRDLDRNAHKTIESLIAPDIAVPQEQNEMCEQLPFCGLPFYSSRQLHTSGYWFPGPAPILKDEAKLQLNERVVLTDSTRLEFTITGKVLLALQLRPRDSVQLIGWDILDGDVPEPNVFQGRSAYFVMMTHGLNAEPKNVSLTFQYESKYQGPLLDLSVVTYHWEYHQQHTSTFAGLLAKMPAWTFTVPTVASVQSWTF